MLKKSQKDRLTWDYIKSRHSEIIGELRTLRNWNEVKSTIPESENLGDYSLLALESVAAVIRELRLETSRLGERIELLSRKLEDLGTSHRELSYSTEKKFRELENRIAELEQRTLFLNSLEYVVPRINELEEKLERLPAQLFARLEESYGKKTEDVIRSLVEERIEALKEELKRDVLGVSVELARALRELQEHYEELVRENVELKRKARENDVLKRKLSEKEKEVESLRKRLSSLQEVAERVESLSEKMKRYETALKTLREVEAQLRELTGESNVFSAIEAIKRQFVPKSKLERAVNEIKGMLAEVESLREENAKLRAENEKLRETLKALLGESSLPEEEL
ncbi:hypothetical protein [Thermococcus sp.]|uniref:hypothetical protein n=1 Tax=Thermococcus sp. TaxID=35749 RepID=UPI00261A4A66|nr:hypothetical protein [Thermococcus sp.]